jgi:hypothetical protein
MMETIGYDNKKFKIWCLENKGANEIILEGTEKKSYFIYTYDVSKYFVCIPFEVNINNHLSCVERFLCTGHYA